MIALVTLIDTVRDRAFELRMISRHVGVYADALIEAGDLRGELIALGCALEAAGVATADALIASTSLGYAEIDSEASWITHRCGCQARCQGPRARPGRARRARHASARVAHARHVYRRGARAGPASTGPHGARARSRHVRRRMPPPERVQPRRAGARDARAPLDGRLPALDHLGLAGAHLDEAAFDEAAEPTCRARSTWRSSSCPPTPSRCSRPRPCSASRSRRRDRAASLRCSKRRRSPSWW